MVDFTSLKTYLKTDVFQREDLKVTAEIHKYKVTDGSYNNKSTIFDYQAVIEGIGIRSQRARRKYDRFGIYSDSSLVFLVPYDEDLNVIDKVYIYGEYYDIIGIDDWTGGQEASLGRKVFLRKNNLSLPSGTITLVDWTNETGAVFMTELGDAIQFKITV